MAKDDLLLVSDVAHELRVRPDVVRSLLFLGHLNGFRRGGRWVVLRESVAAVKRELAKPNGAIRRTGVGCINPR
jgi:hypothetical protein